MRLRFNGIIEKRKGGCSVCGRKTSSDTAFVANRRYYLPSGRNMMFRAGSEYDVPDSDADFLLSYSYTDPTGVVKHVFEAV